MSTAAKAATRQKRLFLFDWDNTLFPSFVYKEAPHGLWVGDVGKKQPYLTSDESIAMYSELHDVSHLNAVGMFVGQPIRAMLSLNPQQPSSAGARAARRRVAAGAWKLLTAARNAGGEIRLVTAGTAPWLIESFNLYNNALEEDGSAGADAGDGAGGGAGAAMAQYTLVIPDTITIPVGGGDASRSSRSIAGYSTVHHQQDKEAVFQKLAAAGGATELVIIGDGDEEMIAASALRLKGDYAVTTIDLRDRRPHDLDAFMANLDFATKLVEGLAR